MDQVIEKKDSKIIILQEQIEEKDRKITEISTDLGILNLENQKLKIEVQKKFLENRKQANEIRELKRQLENANKKSKKKKGKFDLIKAKYPVGNYSYLHKDKYL